MFEVGDSVEYYPGCMATVVAKHEYRYGIVYDIVLSGGVPVSHWRA